MLQEISEHSCSSLDKNMQTSDSISKILSQT